MSIIKSRLNKKDIESLGFTITMEETKPYGRYLQGFYKYKDYFKLEISVSDLKDAESVYVRLSENHFRGNVKGYLKTKEELKNIVEFMTSSR